MNTPAQRPPDSKVVNFLNHVSDLEEALAYERDRATRMAAELSAAQHLINHHENELARLTIDRDRLFRIATVLETHMKQVWGAAEQGIQASLEAARELGRPPLIPDAASPAPKPESPPDVEGAGRMASLFSPKNLNEPPQQ